MVAKSGKEARPASANRRPAAAARGPAAIRTSPAQQLQRSAGNQGAAQVIARAVQARSEAAAARLAAAAGISRAAMQVSSPHDAAEREASARATQIMSMSGAAPASTQRSASPTVQRAPASADSKAQSAPTPPGLRAGIAGGTPLPKSVRAFMEPRFGADFGNVTIHTGDQAATLSRAFNARAFTVGNQIYFGKGAYQPDSNEGRELIAHELTHTIQQGAAVQRSEGARVQERATPHVQRWGADTILDFFADHANALPGYRMFTIALGVNPINMSRVERSPANVMRAVVEFMPGGNLVTRALDNYNVFERAGAWVQHQLDTLGLSGQTIRNAIDTFVSSLDWGDAFHPGDVWNRAVRIFSDPIDRIVRFIESLASGVLQLIKEAILRPLAALAQGTPAWDLLCAVLGENPITREPVARNAETLIGGFMKLIGQEEVWENIKRGNAVSRAWAWFQGALATVTGFVRRIPWLFVEALESLQIEDLVQLPRAFARVAGIFSGFFREFVSWAGEAVWNLLEIIFSVVAPGVMVYLKRARAAFQTILRNPIGFLRNLINAGKLGFNQFLTRFLSHLRTSLIGWLTGTLGSTGVYIPQAFSLVEIVKFILSVLGLTWQNIRAKLVRAVGETAVRAMETGFDIVVTLVREGPAAAWQKIVESLSNLRDMVIEQVMTFVRDRIVQRAIASLLSLLSPVGAFIQAIIGIYNTVMFFVERLRQIAQVAASFIDAISAIANGVLTQAANRVEQTMAGMLTLVISFLARIAGLGNVSEAITNILNRVRAPIDRALDRVVAWIVEQARRLGRFIAQAGVPQDPNERLRLGMEAAVGAANRFAGRPVGRAVLSPLLEAIRVRYGFRVLELVPQGRTWGVRGQINPEAIAFTRAITETQGGTAVTRLIVDPPKILVFEFRRFTANQNVSINEMTEGLSHHQTALNALTVDGWLANIHFRPFLRGAIAAEERDIGRRDLIRQLRLELVAEYRGRGMTLTKPQLDALVVLRSRGRHASHSADAISGGNIDDFDSLERGAVNSYVGSSWGRLRPELESYALHLRQLFEPADRTRVRMNFRLRQRFLN